MAVRIAAAVGVALRARRVRARKRGSWREARHRRGKRRWRGARHQGRYRRRRERRTGGWRRRGRRTVALRDAARRRLAKSVLERFRQAYVVVDAPTEVLVEGRCAVKHLLHILDTLNAPATNILVEV